MFVCLCGCAYSAVVRRLRAVGNIFFQTSQFDWTYLGKVNKSGFWVIISSRVVVCVYGIEHIFLVLCGLAVQIY